MRPPTTACAIGARCAPRNAIDHGEITVSDEGQGIAEDQRERIFEPFYRVTPRSTGAGLGLRLVKQIVANHNGRTFRTAAPSEAPSGYVSDPALHAASAAGDCNVAAIFAVVPCGAQDQPCRLEYVRDRPGQVPMLRGRASGGRSRVRSPQYGRTGPKADCSCARPCRWCATDAVPQAGRPRRWIALSPYRRPSAE